MKKRYLFITALSFTLFFIACKEDKKAIKQTKVSFKKEGELSLYKITSDSSKITLDIEIADTEYDRQTGLMYRDAMLDSQGMLFVFNEESPRSFYMKNTRIPLDLIFVNSEGKIVSFQKNAKPFDESSLPSKTPAKFVLEINAGLADEWELAAGDSLDYQKF